MQIIREDVVRFRSSGRVMLVGRWEAAGLTGLGFEGVWRPARR
jgi:hypothetical protein